MRIHLQFLPIFAALVVLPGCARKEKPQARTPSTAPAPVSKPKRDLDHMATVVKPLVLRSLSIKSGFERAEVRERTNDIEAHWGSVVSVRSWSVQGEDDVWTRVVEIRLGRKSPRNLSGYLAHWRKSHGCTASVVKDLRPILRGGVAPPQLTFSGSCMGGETYLIRVFLVGDTAYELHAEASALGAKASRLRGAMLALLSQIDMDGGRRNR